MLACEMATVACARERSKPALSSRPTKNMYNTTPICAMIFKAGCACSRQNELRGRRPEVPQQRRTQHDACDHLADHPRLAEMDEQFSQPAAQQAESTPAKAARDTGHRAGAAPRRMVCCGPLPLRTAKGVRCRRKGLTTAAPPRSAASAYSRPQSARWPMCGAWMPGWKRWWTWAWRRCGLCSQRIVPRPRKSRQDQHDLAAGLAPRVRGLRARASSAC